MTDCSIRPLSPADGAAVLGIFNYYVENSYAAYPATPLPPQASEGLLKMAAGLPTGAVVDGTGKVIGFGMLRPHHPLPAFARTAEVTYFIHRDYTGKGLGRALLASLEKAAVEKGITSILASISSLNPGSIRFHQANGFVECGRFVKVATKNGKVFDIVWMQKILC